MKFSYFDGDHKTNHDSTFSHMLVLGDKNDRYAILSNTLPRLDYVTVVRDIAEALGPGREMWNDGWVVHSELYRDGHDDCDWEVVDLIPLALSFRTKEHAMIAKLAISSGA